MSPAHPLDDGIEIKPLEGWLSLSEVAELLGVSHSAPAYFLYVGREFDFEVDVRAVGRKPLIVIRESAVQAFKARRDRAAGLHSPAE